MEIAALFALTLLLGALVILVALAVGKRKEEVKEQAEQAAESSGERSSELICLNVTVSPRDFILELVKQWVSTTRAPGSHLLPTPPLQKSQLWQAQEGISLDMNTSFPHMENNLFVSRRSKWSSCPCLFSCRAFITWLANGDAIRIFKMIKKDDGTFSFKAASEDFPQKHKAAIVNIGIAETGKFIMSASTDTTILIWDLKGELLASINTNQMTNSYAAISPCGRFVASCGFTPDVKVWEVCFGKGGEFKEVARAFDLKGHSAGVHAFAFSNDSHRMVTVSKDGTWKLWNTNVEYKKQQDPYLLRTVSCSSSEGSRVALSPDGRVVAISDGCNVTMFDATTGTLEEELRGVHSVEITDLRFDINSRFLVCSGDKAIRVFHNTPGYRAAIRDMKDMLKKAQNEAMKQRLQQQIKEAQSALETVLTASAE
ncbi:PREDICTED: transducin beta-like protein 2 [Cyprinodon variegatus]|uniref:transducin beta-like protein 2 n=1 Tax=Cyprinodon variegatus TaxID=28743 RepID=UPI0007427E0B|nr:PREDICTED: transducin beta-like protein 2 [Cyprinodon variegatus]